MNSIESKQGDLWQTQSTLYNTFKALAMGMFLAVGLAACGGTSSSDTLAAATVPDAPTIGTATGGNAQAVVSFAAPSNNGGSAITGYTVTSSPGGLTGTGASSPITVTGLTNGSNYTFTVHATNAKGDSAESAVSNAVTPAIPTAPTTAAPAPSHTIVASVLTTTANDIAGTDFFPNWGQDTVYTASTVGGVETAKYSALNYEGIQLAANTDFSTAANVHFDVWTADMTSLGFDLISPGPAQFQVNSTLTPGVWNSIDIPLSDFTGVDLANVIQLSFTGVTPATGGTIFVQNIYFWGTGSAPSGLVTSTANDWALGGTADFNGATSSLVTSQPAGGSAANAAKVDIALGAQYDGTTFLTLVNQEFCTTAHPTVSVEVYAPVAGKIVELKLEQDGDPSKNIEMRKYSVAGWSTYTFNCLTDSGLNSLVQPTADYVEGSVYNKASMFFDFDITGGASAAETWYFDSVAYTPTAAVTYVPPVPFAAPTVAANAPANTIQISVLTTSAADVAGTDFYPNWGQATQYVAITVGGVETLQYSALNYEGINLAAPTDISAATHVHLDVWSDVTSLGFNLINSAAVTGGAPSQFQINSTLTTGWNSVDIPLSSFTGVDMTQVDQLMFVGVTPASGGTIYIQNLYFW